MKSTRDFHFRKFSVSQRQSAHKVGTDGVLLGAWTTTGDAASILEIGTGTGVIALMLAQRSGAAARIHAVEINEASALEARANSTRSPWPEKIIVHHSAIQDFNPEDRFELIVTNPPFFTDSLPSPDATRTQARHHHHLTFDDIIDASGRLLSPKGRLALILPADQSGKFRSKALDAGLFCLRECTFRTRPHKPVERFLLEFGFQKAEILTEQLVLYAQDGSLSEAYRRLTGDFYLNV